MLSSTNYFSKDPCPFFIEGKCERPYCPFLHKILDVKDSEENILLTNTKQDTDNETEESSEPIISESEVMEASSEEENLKRQLKIERELREIERLTHETDRRVLFEVLEERRLEEVKEKERLAAECQERLRELEKKEAKIRELEEEKIKATKNLAIKVELENEYEKLLLIGGGSDDEEDDNNLDESISDQFLLPKDVDGDSDEDPDELRRLCYKSWKKSEPKINSSNAEASTSRSNDDETQAESSTTSAKKRVAHAEIVHRPPVLNLNTTRKSPSQVMMERFKKSTEFVKSQSSNSIPQVEKKEKIKIDAPSPTMNSISNSSKRIAHVPNLNNLSKPNLPTSSSSTSRDFGLKGKARVAHVPTTTPVAQERPPNILLDSPLTSKSVIPSNVRQSMLDQIFKECKTLYPSHQDAKSRALNEESIIAANAKIKNIYICNGAKIIKALRDEADVKKSSVSGMSNGPHRKLQSHEALLNGRSYENESWSIHTRRPPQDLHANKLYVSLKKYLLTSAELEEHGFPRPNPSKKQGHVIIMNRTKKQAQNIDSTVRTCDRCNIVYEIDIDGIPLERFGSCEYHHGRLIKKKTKGTFESGYSCCGGEANSGGCCISSSHVSTNPSSEPYGFLSAVKEGNDAEMGRDPWDIVALDCEMVYTTFGNELARVTFVGSDGAVLYDQLVKPGHKILDYNTRFSGITEEMLSNVKTSLADVQAILLSRIKKNSILIGHSLESDLCALKLKHDFIIDTSVLMPHKMGLPYKKALRTLAQDLLGKIIQVGENGHDSAEDARAALEVVLWKVKEDQKLVYYSTPSKLIRLT